MFLRGMCKRNEEGAERRSNLSFYFSKIYAIINPMSKKIFFTTLFIFVLFFCFCTSRSGQPYATQNNNAWSKNACGAFSMAYYLEETGQFAGNKVESTAKALYQKIKFDASAGFGDYSDPLKIMKEIAPYASSVSFKMNIAEPKTGGEKLMALFFANIDASNTDFVENIKDLSTALAKDEYVIEILVPSPNVNLKNPMKNPLHYVLTYWKNNTLYTLDPFRGQEQPRTNFIDGTTRFWNFCNCGIFIKR